MNLWIVFPLNVSVLNTQLATASPAIECYFRASELGFTSHQSILLCTNATSEEPIRCVKEISLHDGDRLLRPLALDLTPDQRVSLCQGAPSLAPAVCFRESFDLPWTLELLSYDQRIKLCNEAVFITPSPKSTHSGDFRTAPIHCFNRTRELRFFLSQDQRVILCADASATDPDEPVKCFERAGDTGLSPDQRVRLCTKLTPSSW